MQMNKRVEQALNNQIKWELYSCYLYLSMSSWLESIGLKGMAHYQFVQAQEEKDHGFKFYNYVISRGGRVILQQIDAPPFEWHSALQSFEHTLEHEKHVTAMIHDLVDLSIAEKDHATTNMLQWFVDEQVEEEGDAQDIVNKLAMIQQGGGNKMLYSLDTDMGKRVYKPLTDAMAPGSQ